MKDVVFLGASTAFYEVMAMINAINSVQPTYRIAAILDDNVATHGKVMSGIRVVGGLNLVHDYKGAQFIFGIGSLKTRLVRHSIINRLELEPTRFEAIVHPTAVIDPSAVIGPGCIVHPGVCVGNDAVLNSFSIVAVNSAIGPYAVLESYAMVTSLVAVLSSARIGKSVFVGSCSCVTEGVTIGRGSMVGAGTVVSRDLNDGCFILGNPGRVISKFDVPEDL
jgi:sugar O-acyltransferase (sialic acid O-acetyltransferase NeuD family)